MFDLAHVAATTQLRNLSEDSPPLLIVHPHYNQPHHLLSPFLEGKGTAYARFEGSNLTHEELTRQLEEALDAQDADALEGVKRLALDECDRAEPDALETFLLALTERIKAHIMVISRRIPAFIYNNQMLQSRSQFIPLESRLLPTDYIAQSKDKSRNYLEVRALGSGRVIVNGRLIETWDGTLPRALFFYLVDRPLTTRREIFETFWPTLSQKEATNVFHVTKRKINEVLGIDLTTYRSGFYQLSERIQLDYDVNRFSELVQTQSANDDETEKALAAALTLYRHDFLTSLEMPWTLARREALRDDFGQAAAELARLAENNGDNRFALGLYLRASATQPQREDLARHIMRLYAEQGMYEAAEQTYERLKTEIERRFQIEPGPDTQAQIAFIRDEAKKVTEQSS